MPHIIKDPKHFGTGDLAILMTSFLWGIGVVAVKSAIGNTPETSCSTGSGSPSFRSCSAARKGQ